MTHLSTLISGFQWAAQHHNTYGIKALNISLGTEPTVSTFINPLDQAVNNLTASNGVLFVVAAGNSGSGYGTLGSPGEADAAQVVASQPSRAWRMSERPSATTASRQRGLAGAKTSLSRAFARCRVTATAPRVLPSISPICASL